jgi:hypothetical protein
MVDLPARFDASGRRAIGANDVEWFARILGWSARFADGADPIAPASGTTRFG